MKEILVAISGALAQIASNATWETFVAFAAVGTISMALLELVKDLTPLRGAFNQRWIGRWIADRVRNFKHWDQVPGAPASCDDRRMTAKCQIAELSVGGLEDALYGMAIEDVTRQINQGAQITLDDPENYGTSLVVLSQGAPIEDLKLVLAKQPTEGSTQAYFDARARVARRIQRNLDGVRIACGSRWKLWMQSASILATVLVVELAVFIHQGQLSLPMLVAFPIAVIGSYFGPITRDILAALQRLRRG